ncbi:MAG: hypothetical protein OEV34_08005 [Gammaproteobacteria bacterium]|nr:hypothetical protein [Gammaproteobacteria bacterium]
MGELTLEKFAAIAEVIGMLTIVSGLIFGIFQLRAHRMQQRNIVASGLAKTFYNPEFAKALVLLQHLPDGASAEDIHKAGPEYEYAAVVVCTSFETMGLLIYRKIAQFDLVMDLAGGVSASMFRKLQNWIEHKRESQNQPSWAEWFEWMARLAEKYKDEHKLTKEQVANWQP